MSSDSEENQEVAAPVQNKKKGKYRKDKPWDNDPSLDKWQMPKLNSKNPILVEQSSFSTLFPAYRTQYLQQILPALRQLLMAYHVSVQLDLNEQSITVTTTKKTFDPYIIIKARDAIKLLARSVPLAQVKKLIEEENIYADIIKIRGLVRNRERFVKRRKRLIGPDGNTLKAIELLTESYIMVQGSTVAVVGHYSKLKQVRKVVVDTMQNIHPIYWIKEMMIKRELAKDPKYQNEDWSRFLPQFQKQNAKKKAKKERKGEQKKEKSLFPPPQLPRKEDIEMETGEYFMTQKQKKEIKQKEKVQIGLKKQEEKIEKRNQMYQAPSILEEIQKDKEKQKVIIAGRQEPSLEELKQKFLSKAGLKK